MVFEVGFLSKSKSLDHTFPSGCFLEVEKVPIKHPLGLKSPVLTKDIECDHFFCIKNVLRLFAGLLADFAEWFLSIFKNVTAKSTSKQHPTASF